MTAPTLSLTTSQNNALSAMKSFVEHRDKCFVLSGYAGTGKTTLVRFFIQYLQKKQIAFCLLSSTGRAAKILSNTVGYEASTIHHYIFTCKGLNKDLSEVDTKEATPDNVGQLHLQFDVVKCNASADGTMVYIIDEASMISDIKSSAPTQAIYGTGRLLHDLLNYDSRYDSKFVFVGDPCQLPPIEGSISPALSPEYLKEVFGYSTSHFALTEIMRQAEDSSIVNATSMIRSRWQKAPESDEIYGNKVWGKIKLSPYADIEIMHSADDMRNRYVSFIRQYGYNEAVFICQSNGDSLKMSQLVRKELGFEGMIQPGDLLMVSQNQITTGLMNGDMVEVLRVGDKPEYVCKNDEKTGYHTLLTFIEVEVRELFSGRTFNTLLLLSLLDSTRPNLDARQQTGLFLNFVLRMRDKDITQKKAEEFKMALFDDPYLNALRCSYGYAITCHKAQGGEWNHVFVQPQRNIMLNPCKRSYQWLYTAITRAKQRVYFVQDFFIE